MLKIKSNTNEFTIIFSEKIGKKINAEKFSVPTLSFFQLQHHTFFFFFFFVFLFQPFSVLAFLLLFLFFLPFFFLFSSRVPFFSAQKHSFQPKTILSSAQKHFFQPKRFSVFQPKRFSVFFQPKRFCFSPKPFLVQPTPLFQPLFVLFQPFFFLLVLFSAHLFFLFSASFSSFFFSASFSFSCQLPRPKIFSLDASHFFYMNKSLFSSNLE